MSTLPNECLSSTTYDVEVVKIKRPRRAQVPSASEASTAGGSIELTPGRQRAKALRAWRFAKRLAWRKPVDLKVHVSTGNDPMVIVRARGHVQRYPWDTAILDIISDVCNR
jgi:hypothetical protein